MEKDAKAESVVHAVGGASLFGQKHIFQSSDRGSSSMYYAFSEIE